MGKSGGRKNTPPSAPSVANGAMPHQVQVDPGVLLRRARELKEQGNRLFESRDYPGALRQYELALSLAPSGHPDRAVFHSNRAACLLELRPVDHNAIAEECSLALQVDPRFPRALLRRARALQALGRYELALVDTLALLELDPNHRDAVDLAHALRSRISSSSTSASTASIRPFPAFYVSAVIAGRDPSQDAGDSTKEVAESEQCGHYSREVPHLNKLLFEIKSSKSKHLACKDCLGADGEKGSAAKPKGNTRDIWVCLDCGQNFCGGLVSQIVPYGHARRHCRKNRHSWAARYNTPDVVYCVSCKSRVPIKMPSEMPKVEQAAAAADKLIGVAASNEHVLANSHGNVIKGLPNLGNTCFFNSVLQSLLALDKFRSKMLGPDVPEGMILMSLKKLFVETSYSNDSGGLLSPRSLYTSICKKFPCFEGNWMQDSHELLLRLLDGLDVEETEARKLAKDATSPRVPEIVDSIFAGQLSSSVSSLECNHGSVKHEKFLNISLPIPSRKTPAKSVSSPPVNMTSFGEPEVTSDANKETTTSVDTDVMAWSSNSADQEVDSNSHVSVEGCFTLFTEIEPLSTPWLCEHCSIGSGVPVYKTAKRRFLISKAPPVMTITLNRFSHDIHGRYKKLKGHVGFEETLDIRPFIDRRFQENYSTTYRLVAVVEHIGTIDEGHYVAYVRSGKMQGWQQQQQQSRASKSWFYASDSHVKVSSMQEVHNCEAYILFYERVIEQDKMSGGVAYS